MEVNGIIQITVKFKTAEFPLLAQWYRTCKRGGLTSWLCQLAERELMQTSPGQLDRIEQKLDKLLSGQSVSGKSCVEHYEKEPDDLIDALANLGL